jgi:hypothetical protein
MGSEPLRLADFYGAPQHLSSIVASYSCPQRETLTQIVRVFKHITSTEPDPLRLYLARLAGMQEGKTALDPSQIEG